MSSRNLQRWRLCGSDHVRGYRGMRPQLFTVIFPFHLPLGFHRQQGELHVKCNSRYSVPGHKTNVLVTSWPRSRHSRCRHHCYCKLPMHLYHQSINQSVVKP